MGDNGQNGHNGATQRRRAGRGDAAPSLDQLDRDIFDALHRNGRESIRNVANALGVSEATVRNRYGAMVESDAMQVTAIANPSGLGYESMAMLAISTTGVSDKVGNEIASWAEASLVVMTAGHHDVIVEVVCRDRQHLLELINRVRAIEEVTSTETFVYLDMIKQTYDWRPTSE